MPAELRAVLRANQRDGYGVLMQACAAAIIELARDPRYVDSTVAVLAVLHTWTQQLSLHPHVHCLVSGGGISEDASTWHLAWRKFLVPIKALARMVRGKFRALLRRKCANFGIPDAVWRIPWILHATAWGNGEQAVLDCLARYVFRVALTNARIVDLDQTVAIQYKERTIARLRTRYQVKRDFGRPRKVARQGGEQLPSVDVEGSAASPTTGRSGGRIGQQSLVRRGRRMICYGTHPVRRRATWRRRPRCAHAE